MTTSAILHVVAMPVDVSSRGESYFQGFSLALFPEYIYIFHMLGMFPHDVLELFLSGSSYVSSKIAGSSLDVQMVRADLLDDAHVEIGRPLTVVWSATECEELVEQRLHQFAVRPLHLTMGDSHGGEQLANLNWQRVHELLQELVARAAETTPLLSGIAGALMERGPVDRSVGPLPFVPRLHNCTVPLLETLRAYGYDGEEGQAIKPDPGTDEHVAGMVELGRLVDEIRAKANDAETLGKNDVIVFCPSSFAYLYKADSQHWNRLYRELGRDRRNFLKNALIRNKGYSNFTMTLNGALGNVYEDSVLGPLLSQRQFELKLFSILMGVVATNQFAPAYRLPNSVMLHHDKLRNIYSEVTSDKKNRALELSRRLADYGRTILSEIGPALVEEVFRSRHKILAVCDFPIEWVPVGQLPAMFKFEISRVPTTPGNVSAQVLLSGQRVIVPVGVLSRVLIVRSFGAADPIKDHLFKAIEEFSKNEGLKNVEIDWVDVSTEQELVDAFNEFDGAIVVLDCHGNHGGEEQHAWLHIGNEKVDVWNLANRARVPPIVILAACSTHPVDGSHASVANGLLRSGAISVLATYAPVHSVHTAVSVARLLYRLSAFVPLLAGRRPCSWREIVSGFFRMSYATDVLRDLLNKLGDLAPAQYVQIHQDANAWINSGDPDWFEKLQQAIASATGRSDEEMEKLWAERYQFVETMLLVQLGRPENILIAAAKAESVQEDLHGDEVLEAAS